MTLLDRIQKLRNREDFDEIQEEDSYLDLVSRRRAEILSEFPVPFCCPLIAGARVAIPTCQSVDFSDTPQWTALYPVLGNGSAESRVNACPFCGTKLPSLTLKKDPPPEVCKSDGYYCESCKERLDNCLCSHPLSVYEVENAPPVFAVTALITKIVDGRKLYLSVSRKDDPNDLGLPGGKVDPGETPSEALTRETYEEAGLTILDFHQIFDAQDSTSKRCLTYEVVEFSGEISTKEAGVVAWVDQKALTDSGLTFEIYNRALFHHIDPHNYHR